MGTVNVEIGGRSYPLSCRDGDEPHLVDLAAVIAEKVQGLTQSLGTMTEARLLLMAALMVADELFEARNGGQPARTPPRDPDPEVAGRLTALLHRAETLAAQLEA
jgi:cell division protein ZapA